MNTMNETKGHSNAESEVKELLTQIGEEGYDSVYPLSHQSIRIERRYLCFENPRGAVYVDFHFDPDGVLDLAPEYAEVHHSHDAEPYSITDEDELFELWVALR